MRYFLHLAYQGTNYRGYQRQPDQPSVQQTLEETLSEVLRQNIIFSGCGRTDAEVHASQYFGSIDVESPLPDHFITAMNRRLPGDISVFEAIPVADNASAQSHATERVYDYFIHFNKDAGLYCRSSKLELQGQIDLAPIQSVITQIPNYKDFRAFCKTPDRHNTTICDLRAIRLFTDEGNNFLRFQFRGNRYLRGMIRLLVGNLIRIGEGRLSPDAFIEQLSTATPPKFNHLAPPDGLYLSEIHYPFFKRANQSPLQKMLESLTTEQHG